MKIVLNYLKPQSYIVSNDFVVVDVMNNTYVNLENTKQFYVSRSGKTLGIDFKNQLMPHHFIYSKHHQDDPIPVLDEAGNKWDLFVYFDVKNAAHYLIAKNYQDNILLANKVNQSMNTIDWINKTVSSKTELKPFKYLEIFEGKVFVSTLRTNDISITKKLVTPKMCDQVKHLGCNLVKFNGEYFLLHSKYNYVDSYTVINPYKFLNKSYKDIYFTPEMKSKSHLFVGKFHDIGRNNPNIKIREIIAIMYRWSLVCEGKETLFLIKEGNWFILKKVMVICDFMITKIKEIFFNDLNTLNLKEENLMLKKRCVQHALDLFRSEDVVKLKQALRNTDGDFTLTVKSHFSDYCEPGVIQFIKDFNLAEEVKVKEIVNHPELNIMLMNSYFRDRLISLFVR